MKTTKTILREALYAATATGRVQKRTFAEVVARINALLVSGLLDDGMVGYRSAVSTISALLWAQGFTEEHAIAVAVELIKAANEAPQS